MKFIQQEFNHFVLSHHIIGIFEQPITLVSGRKSHWYVNWRNVFNNPYHLEKVAQFILGFTKDKGFQPDCFYGVPEGATKLGIITQYLWAMSNVAGGSTEGKLSFHQRNVVLPMGRAKPKEHGAPQDKYFVGMPQGKVIVLEDTTTRGESLLKSVQQLQAAGINVIAALNLTNRNVKRDDGTTIADALHRLGVQYYALSNALDLLPDVVRELKPSPEVILHIEKEFEQYGIRKIGFDRQKYSQNKTSLTISLTAKQQAARKKICLPLDDLYTLEDVQQRIEDLSPYVGMFKIGKELFTRFGPEVVLLAKKYGDVFLDLKYHDIPTTVRLACKAAAELGVSILTVHASGGKEMMQAAVQGVKEGTSLGASPPKVIAVTVLTSLTEEQMNRELNIPGKIHDQVLHLATMAKEAGCDGIVCSAADLAEMGGKLPKDMLIVTPGIQGITSLAGNDQQRVLTPGKAIAAGSSLLVIGRSITNANDHQQAALEILDDIANVLPSPKRRIDPHVHFRDEEQSYKETIAHGLQLAKEQGVDYVFDMPNTATPLLRETDVLRRLTFVPEAEKQRYFMYLGATSDITQLREAVRLVKEHPRVIGIKMYAGRSTGDLAIIEEKDQQLVYRTLAEEQYKGVLAVHCEKESCMTDTFDYHHPISHAQARPKRAEIESLKDQLLFAREEGFQGVLHICHISTPEAVELVYQMKNALNGDNRDDRENSNQMSIPFSITCGITPHHLLWDEEQMNLPQGLLYKMNPPLRKKEDVFALRELLKQGKIDWIETDHAPHQVGEKLHGCCPSGYPSLYLYKDFVEKFLPSLGLDEEQINRLTFDNIVQAFKLDV